MGTQAFVAEVSDKPRFTQTCLTGRTMRFTHDSSRGSSSTPVRYAPPPQEKMLPCVRAEWDIHHWAHFPFPARLRCTALKKDYFLLTFTVFAKTITSRFELDGCSASPRLMDPRIYTVDCAWPVAKSRRPVFKALFHSHAPN